MQNAAKIKIIAVIPARGGSKGVPLKNIARLGNKTLLEHTINHALNSKSIDLIIVSSDNNAILNVAKKYSKYGVQVEKRPEILAQDHSTTVSVLKHILNNLRKKGIFPDFIITLQPTSPFRKKGLIDNAISKLIRSKNDSLVSISKATHSPYKMFKLEQKKLKKLFPQNKFNNLPRQKLPVIFRENGNIYITKPDLIKKNRIMGINPEYIILDQWQSIDIDEEFDLAIARTLINKFK